LKKLRFIARGIRFFGHDFIGGGVIFDCFASRRISSLIHGYWASKEILKVK
jgi:hypothetical protein